MTAIEEAIAAADEAIREETGSKKCGEPKPSNSLCAERTCPTPLAPTSPSDDPDDLAAAFFAQQAKKEEMERKLPVEEWTELFPNLRLGAPEEAPVCLQSSDVGKFLKGMPTFRMSSIASELRSDLDALDASHPAREKCDSSVPMSTECTISSNQMRDLVQFYALTMTTHNVESAGLKKLVADMKKEEDAFIANRSMIKDVLVEKLFVEFKRARESSDPEKRAGFPI
mmetsp:Transcript_45788/g.139095  ORF Transcript_45788/g.139095 Transcript_45788/m.139095 type:complete len:227 (-) Transcript_45788:846-1526(-)